MLNIKLMKQTFHHCGPFCLKMVFNYYGKIIEAKEIAKIAKTTIRYGTSPSNMVMTAKHFGFDAEYKDKLSLKELNHLVVKKKIPVIVDWFDGDDGHYSIVVGFDSKNIYFVDPESATRKKMALNIFMRVWFDFTGDYMNSKDDLRLRPVIIVKNRK